MQNIASQNTCFAYNENFLLSMLLDEQKDVRQTAVNKIIEIWSANSSTTFREYKKPDLNFGAKFY